MQQYVTNLTFIVLYLKTFSVQYCNYSSSVNPDMWPVNGFCEVQVSSVLASQAALYPSVCIKVLLMWN